MNKSLYNLVLASIVSLPLMSSALANEIYISQVGDTLDLDITQDGQDNQIGTSSQDAIFGVTGVAADSMTFSITQTGNTNTIAAQIYGNTYTGTWTFTGNSNSVDLLCDSTVQSGQCETVTVDIDTTGSSNAYKVYIGETNDASNLIADFTVTGDNNVFDVDIDGTNADITVTVNNSSPLSTAGVTSTNSLSASSGGNVVDISSAGDGDVNGHTVDLTITGANSQFTIAQSGIYDNTIVGSFTGDDLSVDITQSD